jgi:hypothetical protein
MIKYSFMQSLMFGQDTITEKSLAACNWASPLLQDRPGSVEMTVGLVISDRLRPLLRTFVPLGAQPPSPPTA